MSRELEREIARLHPGEHVCQIYEDLAQRVAAVVAFFKDGFSRNERCIYFTDDCVRHEVVQALTVGGVDAAVRVREGALQFLLLPKPYVVGGRFDPQATVDFIRREENRALADGFSGLRLAGDTLWAFGSVPGSDRLTEYEALLNLIETGRTTILCQYDASRFEAPCLHDVLRTHPAAILGEQVCPNPYYEPSALVLDARPSDSSALLGRRVDWWTANLKHAHAAESERRRAEEELKQSERRLAEAQRVARIGSWERDLRTDEVLWSQEIYHLFGLPAKEGSHSYAEFVSLVHPEDRERVRTVVAEAVRENRAFSCHYRTVRPDGRACVMHDRGEVILNADGEPVRLIGTCQDVTELREAEQAREEYAARLQALSHRLLEVQEAERQHLARELHDEIGQLLTALRLRLEPAADETAQTARARFEQACGIVDRLFQQVRDLSFALRPAVLDHLGLLPALLALIEWFTGQTGIAVSFRHTGVKGRFSRETETTAYRIVQEALTNVARHAGVGEATVRVWADAHALSVQIEDRGRGFDRATAMANPRSMGLRGMRERALLLGGNLTIDSSPGEGQQITAELPLRGPGDAASPEPQHS